MSNWPEDWREKHLKAMLEEDAVRHFKPAKEVAHFQSQVTGHALQCHVWYDGVDSWAWSTTKMIHMGGETHIMHTMRSGYEQTREAAMLASYNAAKELAGE